MNDRDKGGFKAYLANVLRGMTSSPTTGVYHHAIAQCIIEQPDRFLESLVKAGVLQIRWTDEDCEPWYRVDPTQLVEPAPPPMMDRDSLIRLVRGEIDAAFRQFNDTMRHR